MKALERLTVAIAFTLVAAPLNAQSAGSGFSFDVAGGMMRYGPHALAGVELSSPRFPLTARVDALVGVAPAHEVPGRMFTALMIGAALPFNADGRVSPYLLGGAALSQSRHLEPALGGAAGVGARLRIGALSPFVEGRMQHRAGPTLSLGLRF
jgi:hypothetical protein